MHNLYFDQFINFSSPTILADVTIKKLLEGNSIIQCRSLQAKMINGDAIDVSASVVAIDAVYGAMTSIEAADNITVGLMRGQLEV